MTGPAREAGVAERAFFRHVPTKEVADTHLAAEVGGSAPAAALVVAVENCGRHGCTGDLGDVAAASLAPVWCRWPDAGGPGLPGAWRRL